MNIQRTVIASQSSHRIKTDIKKKRNRNFLNKNLLLNSPKILLNLNQKVQLPLFLEVHNKNLLLKWTRLKYSNKILQRKLLCKRHRPKNQKVLNYQKMNLMKKNHLFLAVTKRLNRFIMRQQKSSQVHLCLILTFLPLHQVLFQEAYLAHLKPALVYLEINLNRNLYLALQLLKTQKMLLLEVYLIRQLKINSNPKSQVEGLYLVIQHQLQAVFLEILLNKLGHFLEQSQLKQRLVEVYLDKSLNLGH